MEKNLPNNYSKKDKFLAAIRIGLEIGIPLVGIFFILNVPLMLFNFSLFKQQYMILFWSLTLALLFLSRPAKKAAPKNNPPWYDLVAAVLTLIIGFWVFIFIPKVMMTIGIIYPIHIIFGVITYFIVLESVRRTTGWSVVSVIVIFTIYAKFGYLIEGLLGASTLSWQRFFQQVLLGSDFLLGIPLQTVSITVFGFVFFGTVYVKLGAADFIMDLCLALMGKVRGGPAKVSVISSALFGTISGSAVANVIATGTITIPLMKRTGYKDYYAGAVEAVASTGGQVMPPIMGAAAFVMADYLGIPYATVIFVAVIPAILYYFGLFVQVDSEAIKLNLEKVPKELIKPLRDTLKIGWIFIAPIVVMLYVLFVMYQNAGVAALYSIAAAVIVSFFNKKTRNYWSIRNIVDVLQTVTHSLFSIVSVCGAAGLIIGCIAYSGLGISFSQLLTEATGGSLFYLALLTALASVILGMGMPTTPAYIMLAVLAVPAMTSLGVLPITAHLFCVFYSTASMITPPVCLAVFAASTLSGAPIGKIAWQAIKLAFAGYVVPFIFLFSPALALIGGTLIERLVIITFTTIAIYLVGISFEGYAVNNKLKMTERLLFFIITAVLILPNPEMRNQILMTSKIIGSAIAFFFIFSLVIKNKRLLKTKTA